jgi:large subunit ribosomal protein L18
MSLKTVKRRRLECKTDYVLRLGLLKAKFPRIVVRRTNKYFIAQIVESSAAQDKVILGVTSQELLEHGWDKKATGSLKSIPAGYLTGYLLAKKAKSGEYVIDLGMARTHKGGRLFSVIAGLKDGGLNVHANEEVFPTEERLMGEGLKPEVKTMIVKVKENLGSTSTVKAEKKEPKTTKKTETKK